jgi:dGTPase
LATLNIPIIAVMEWSSLISTVRSGGKSAGKTFRSVFEQDYDRVVFSEPFRRLQDKTQVHPLPEHDFVHNRLTHSLEVSSVGRSLGKQVGDIVLSRHPELQDQFNGYDFAAIVATASLAHDIGNPPFGHSGESAISTFFSDNALGKEITGQLKEAEAMDLHNFEGNAQGFRLLTKKNYQGLQLTYTTLAAFTKYPRPSVISNKDPKRRSQKKFGYFQTEAEVFNQLVNELQLKQSQKNAWLRHPLTYLVEAADDICYHIIDLEDGCRLGLVSFEDTKSLLAPILGERYKADKLNNIQGTIEKLGMLRALVISKLVEECVMLFNDNEDHLLSGKYDKALTDEIPSWQHLKNIIDVSVQDIYRSERVVEKEAAGYEILPGLTSLLMEAILAFHYDKKISSRHRTYFNILPADLRFEIEQLEGLYPKIRSGLDYISGLTDRNALLLYRKIKGMSISL